MRLTPPRAAVIGRRGIPVALATAIAAAGASPAVQPDSAGSAQSAAKSAPDVEVSRKVLEGCTGAGLERGSPGWDACARELETYIRSRRKAAPGKGTIPARIAPGLNIASFCGDYYSKKLRKSRAEGVVVVFFYIGTDGRVKHVVIDQTSGLPLLDSATARCLSDPRVLFTPQLTDGVPTGSWEHLKYTWKAP